MSSQTLASEVDLKLYDYELYVDKSGSMDEKDCPGNASRWQWAEETVYAFARKTSEFDSDGITLNFFAGSLETHENVTPEKVKELFSKNRPNGGTVTGAALRQRLEAQRKRHAAGNVKPTIHVVITDGGTTDREDLATAIVTHANWMSSDEQTGILFLQVGNDDEATKMLKFLDDELVVKRNAKFDIVDTKTFADLDKMSIEDCLKESLSD